MFPTPPDPTSLHPHEKVDTHGKLMEMDAPITLSAADGCAETILGSATGNLFKLDVDVTFSAGTIVDIDPGSFVIEDGDEPVIERVRRNLARFF